MRKSLAGLLEIIATLAMAALFVYITVSAFRDGDDFWFAIGVPCSAWAIWRYVKVGEPKERIEVQVGTDARDAAARAIREWGHTR